MLWTTDEEIGSETSRAAIEDEARRSEAVLVLEPSLPGGAVKTSRKGCGDYQLIGARRRGARRHRSAEGRERHSRAGAPDPGRSTRCRISRAGSRSTSCRCPAGCGRTSSRTKRARSSTCGCRRPPPRAEVDAAFRGARGPRRADARIEVSGGFDRPPLERTRPVARLYDQARAVAQRARAGAGRRRHRRRVRREFHRRARGSHTRWPWRDRRRRARATRTRGNRRPGRPGRARRRTDCDADDSPVSRAELAAEADEAS